MTSVTVAELLSLALDGEEVITSVRGFMKEVVDERLNGNMASLARGLGISPVKARQYTICEDLPRIRDWELISEIAGVSLLDLLPCHSLPPDLGDHPWFRDTSRLSTRGGRPKGDLTATIVSTALRGALDAEAAVSLNRLAMSLGTHYSCLQRFEPELAAEVSKRFRLSVSARAEARRAKFQEDLVRAVDDLLAAGKFPTPSRVKARIDRKFCWFDFYKETYESEVKKRKLVNADGFREARE
ncbi:hypothetical protein AYM40_20840 [Paraburkholderia phytofirmans OLGA172]|uniref:Uncharacterized protein n=1 Tax=Paraburkholderia phytofirmans OLGA172 TaxID=1417228 RepID=A0A160FPX0_9BURK|nr:hypothetical protein AYM40_20840 [Paraburkholderia phytofirmans OLGA172]